jgi:condensin complex subunit 2
MQARFLSVQKGAGEEQEDESTPEFWANRMEGDVSMSGQADAVPASVVEGTFLDGHDEYDDFDFEDGDAGMGDVVAGNLGSEFIDSGNYGDQLVAQPKKVTKLQINYAKTAKKVDVKKLKDNIWKTLSDASAKDTMSREHEFSDVIKDLKKAYPETKLKDISVAFCFICLLHLANEKKLVIDAEDDLRQLRIRQG